MWILSPRVNLLLVYLLIESILLCPKADVVKDANYVTGYYSIIIHS